MTTWRAASVHQQLASHSLTEEKDRNVITRRLPLSLAAVSLLVAGASCFSAVAQPPSNASVYATGLAGPRGLKFGPDGLLYVAEAGFGGTHTTGNECAQVPAPVGPYLSGDTARISVIDHDGKRTTVASGFPSSINGLPTPEIEGVADVAFLDGELYAVLAGGGCSHGSDTPNGVVRVDVKTGSWTPIANLSRFLREHPAKYVNRGDFEPDGVFYSLIEHRDRLYTVEPNHGQMLSISERGDIREVIDLSEAEGHIVPTAVAARDGHFYVGNLGSFPIVPESAKILTVGNEMCADRSVPGLDEMDELSRRLKVVRSRAGFTTVVAVGFGPDGLLYALELSAAPGFPAAGSGKVVRLNREGDIEDVATGLVVPTGMTFGPDGRLYVSNFGAAPAGAGQIVRIDLP
jgi:hypothetical protein